MAAPGALTTAARGMMLSFIQSNYKIRLLGSSAGTGISSRTGRGLLLKPCHPTGVPRKRPVQTIIPVSPRDGSRS